MKMGEILNGKNAKITELTLPDGASGVTLDNTTPYMYVDSFSVSAGTEVGEHELVGTDQKIFSEGVKNAVVNVTVRFETGTLGGGATSWFDVLEAIKDDPVNSTIAITTGDDYFIKIELKNKAGTTIAALTPNATAWASCEVGELDFPANDIVSIPLTLRYGELDWAAT
jgi:hypothetical protein